MKIVGLIFLLVSSGALAKTDYILTCEYQGQDGKEEMRLLLDMKENLFQILHSDFVEVGTLATGQTFYTLELFPSHDNKGSQKFKATINRITGEFTLNYIPEYPAYKKPGEIVKPLIGKCSKNEFRQAL